MDVGLINRRAETALTDGGDHGLLAGVALAGGQALDCIDQPSRSHHALKVARKPP